ncbi:hypothetical protein [Roseateles sp. P5_E8]
MLGLCAWGAQAQTDIVGSSEAQRLGCLVKPAATPRYPERSKLDAGFGVIRLLLTFSRPDAKPAVQVLFNTARTDMQDQAYRYAEAFRLPCLKPEDGKVSAVQELQFRNHDGDPAPLLAHAEDDTSDCLVRPRTDINYKPHSSLLPGKPEVEHLVAQIRFSGDGRQPPEVNFAYNKASSRFEKAARQWLAEFRMPCRGAQDKPRTIEQYFVKGAAGRSRHAFTHSQFTLQEFIDLMREPEKQPARFDLNSMGCPFKVEFTVGSEKWPHQASVAGRTDPNKVLFLRWMASLRFDFESPDVADDVFGSRLQVDVPCGVVSFETDPGAG